MKKFDTLMFAFIAILILSLSIVAQQAGDYRTQSSGNWSSAQIWQRYNGSSWGNTGTPPTGNETITVQSADSVFVNVLVTITDTLINQGRIEPADSLTITIADGGVYQHDQDSGTMAKCIWETGSTVYITGVTGTAPADRNQNYYNMVFNTPGLLSNLNMDLDDVTIGGDIRVIDTGLGRWYLTSTVANDTSIVTIMGDIIVENGNFSSQGTSNAFTTFIIHDYGNIIVTGGNFSVARGSQGSGTGSTRWYLYEGDFSMSNATTQNSNPSNAWFVFAKQGTQTLTLGAGNTLTALPIEIGSGTTLDMGASVLEGSGIFHANAGATLMTTVAGGVSGILSAVTGSVTLEDESSYVFNGTVAQVTSAMMPDTVMNLTIDNAAGVALSQQTVINGVLHLVSGVFDNTIPFTFGPGGTISFEGGSLLIPLSVKTLGLNIPQTFFIEQNYPNPFNPSTSIRFGLPNTSSVTAKLFNVLGQEVATLFEGRLNAGEHELQFDGSSFTSGIYFYRIQAGDNVGMKRMVLMK